MQRIYIDLEIAVVFGLQTEAEAMWWRGRFETRLLFKYQTTSLTFRT